MADRTLRVAPRPEVHYARSFTFIGRFLHVETFSNPQAPRMLSRIWLFATLSSATHWNAASGLEGDSGGIVRESQLVVDTRNATKGIDSPKIVRC